MRYQAIQYLTVSFVVDTKTNSILCCGNELLVFLHDRAASVALSLEYSQGKIVDRVNWRKSVCPLVDIKALVDTLDSSANA